MKKLRNFKCSSCGYKFELLIPDDNCEVKCKCGWYAHRMISAPRVLGNTVGASPSFSRNKY